MNMSSDAGRKVCYEILSKIPSVYYIACMMICAVETFAIQSFLIKFNNQICWF